MLTIPKKASLITLVLQAIKIVIFFFSFMIPVFFPKVLTLYKISPFKARLKTKAIESRSILVPLV